VIWDFNTLDKVETINGVLRTAARFLQLGRQSLMDLYDVGYSRTALMPANSCWLFLRANDLRKAIQSRPHALVTSEACAMTTTNAVFCSQCGSKLIPVISPDDSRIRSSCPSCAKIVYSGPQVLVLNIVMARDRMLLVRRGTEPYVGTWAQPGGYVEESELLKLPRLARSRRNVNQDSKF
jgi:hypothetical protein